MLKICHIFPLLVVYCMEWRIDTGDLVGVKEGDEILLEIRKIFVVA